MYLSAKKNGGYDGGGYHQTCFRIPKTVITPGMGEYFDSPAYRERVHWDELVHRAANRSLDLTIERLGRDDFERNLARFRRAKVAVAEACASVRFPCTAAGVRRNDEETDCFRGDIGCGFDCIDSIMESFEREDRTIL